MIFISPLNGSHEFWWSDQGYSHQGRDDKGWPYSANHIRLYYSRSYRALSGHFGYSFCWDSCKYGYNDYWFGIIPALPHENFLSKSTGFFKPSWKWLYFWTVIYTILVFFYFILCSFLMRRKGWLHHYFQPLNWFPNTSWCIENFFFKTFFKFVCQILCWMCFLMMWL